MPPTLQASGIERLSVEDRAALAQAIWNGIPTAAHLPLLTDLQGHELDRRLADHAASPDDAGPWELIKAESLARWQR